MKISGFHNSRLSQCVRYMLKTAASPNMARESLERRFGVLIEPQQWAEARVTYQRRAPWRRWKEKWRSHSPLPGKYISKGRGPQYRFDDGRIEVDHRYGLTAEIVELLAVGGVVTWHDAMMASRNRAWPRGVGPEKSACVADALISRWRPV